MPFEDADPDFSVPEDLSGQLLIAHPALNDPNFRRTVIYLLAHDMIDGVMGVVLNRPSGKTAGELLPGVELGPLEDVPVYFGGPVGENQLTFTAIDMHQEEQNEADDDADPLEMRHVTIAEAVDMHDSPRYILRAFIGYAGWTGGQLESEIAQNAWMLHDPDFDHLAATDPKTTWRSLISSFGPVYRLLAEAPDDPSLN